MDTKAALTAMRRLYDEGLLLQRTWEAEAADAPDGDTTLVRLVHLTAYVNGLDGAFRALVALDEELGESPGQLDLDGQQ